MKMKWKRLGAALVSLTCVLGLLAGCGGNGGSTGGTESTGGTASTGTTDTGNTGGGSADMVFSWWGNQVRNDRTTAAIELYMEQNPGVVIDGQFSDWSDYWNKLATASAGNSLPDVVQMDYAYIVQYVESGLLLDLTPYIESGALDVSKIDDGVLASAEIGDGIYAMVAGVNAPAMAYNKTLTDENGVTITDNMTMDEFIEVAREMYEKTGYGITYGHLECQGMLDYWIRAEGKSLYNEDGTLGISSADDVLSFFEFYEQGMEEGWLLDVSVFAERSIGVVEEDPLVMGSSASQRAWVTFPFSNQYEAFLNAADGFEIAMTTRPSHNPKASNYLKPGQFFSVTTQSSDPDAAVAFLNYLINSQDCNDILLGERGVPANSEVAEKVAAQLSETQQEVFTYVNDVVTPNSSAISPPDANEASEVHSALNGIQERLLYGQIDAATAAEEFYAAAAQIMG